MCIYDVPLCQCSSGATARVQAETVAAGELTWEEAGALVHGNDAAAPARLQSSFAALVTCALLAKFKDWNCSKPRLMGTFRLVRRVLQF
jgi:hypothetical protein